jgi:hypothetical protein
LNIGVAMLLVAGAALGLWLVGDLLGWFIKWISGQGAEPQNPPVGTWFQLITVVLVSILGGLSSVGVPLLLLTARDRPWGAGRLLWFACGIATWLLWPPVIYQRLAHGTALMRTASGSLFAYGTPLLAVTITLALLAGGRLNRSRRRRISRSWQETFGLLLGLLWACMGIYMTAHSYYGDLFDRR